MAIGLVYEKFDVPLRVRVMVWTGQGSPCLLLRHLYDYLWVTPKLKVRVKKGVRIRFHLGLGQKRG